MKYCSPFLSFLVRVRYVWMEMGHIAKQVAHNSQNGGSVSQKVPPIVRQPSVLSHTWRRLVSLEVTVLPHLSNERVEIEHGSKFHFGISGHGMEWGVIHQQLLLVSTFKPSAPAGCRWSWEGQSLNWGSKVEQVYLYIFTFSTLKLTSDMLFPELLMHWMELNG